MTQTAATIVLSKHAFATVDFMELGNNVLDVIALAQLVQVLPNARLVHQAQISTIMENVLKAVLEAITSMPIIYANLACPTVFFATKRIAVQPVQVVIAKVFRLLMVMLE